MKTSGKLKKKKTVKNIYKLIIEINNQIKSNQIKMIFV